MSDQEREVHIDVQDANTGRSWRKGGCPDYKVMLYLSIGDETPLPASDAKLISCRLDIRLAERTAYALLREVSLCKSSIEGHSESE